MIGIISCRCKVVRISAAVLDQGGRGRRRWKGGVTLVLDKGLICQFRPQGAVDGVETGAVEADREAYRISAL